jgi:hypothetical protein
MLGIWYCPRFIGSLLLLIVVILETFPPAWEPRSHSRPRLFQQTLLRRQHLQSLRRHKVVPLLSRLWLPALPNFCAGQFWRISVWYR